MNRKVLALGSVAVVALAAPAFAQTAAPAPVSQLVRSVDIPFQQFTLPNGLRVIVHTDRKAPIVAVSVWYDVGSKSEPKGSTGFAHLYEHLMYNGSENAPGEFFTPLKSVGATDYNGTTSFDRTNFFETVPTAALDRALFLESDRMGHLTGAITQSVLDEQRGVVQNEKRQNDNQPYGLVAYQLIEGTLPAGHPYAHSPIGSMADLDAASLQTVKAWFHDHYGPNNAVLTLAGDIDAATARRLVTKYFGDLPRGPQGVKLPAPVVPLAAPKQVTIKDRVAATLVLKSWPVPGFNDKDAAALQVAAGALGGLESSRLNTALVKQDKLAVQVSANIQSLSQVGIFTIQMVVRPGADVAAAQARLDAVVADFLRTGPTADEVQRVVTTNVARRIRGLESVGGFGGKAVALAQGALLSGDPAFYKKQLAQLAAQTPASVKATADTWLTKPAQTITVVPGARDAYQEAQVPAAVAVKAAPDQPVTGTRGPLPAVGAVPAIAFPAITHAQLANGVELVYAQRTAVPVTQMAMVFDAGAAADVAGKLGTQQLTLNAMAESTTTRDAQQLAVDEERLGANIDTGFTSDRTTISLDVPSANLPGAVDLLADVVRHPAFGDAEVARIRAQQLAGIQQELTNPAALAARVLPRLIYGPASPYAKVAGSGDPRAVAMLTPADLRAFQQAWLRPDKAKVFVVSDRPIAEVKAALDRGFGDWRATGAAGTKSFAAASAPSAPKIVLVDRPDSPQSLIVGAIPTALKGPDDLLVQNTANDALGGSFLSRINLDLRENRHWSYGASGGFRAAEYAAPYVINAPVQANQTGPSLASLRQDLTDYLGAKPMTADEFGLATQGNVRSLSGNFETGGAVLNIMQVNDLYRRPDNYVSRLTARYGAMTVGDLNTSIKGAIDPSRAVWVVVGDAKTVKPQLDSLGLPVEVVSAASVAGGQ